MLKENNKINKLISGAFQSLNSIVDVNTVVGKPIKTDDGVTIIPISKVTMGVLTGGGEYGDLKIIKKESGYPFGGGSGAVMSLKPYGFLIDSGQGYKLVETSQTPLDKLVETASDYLQKAYSNEKV